MVDDHSRLALEGPSVAGRLLEMIPSRANTRLCPQVYKTVVAMVTYLAELATE